MKSKLTFEESLSRLQEIVSILEKGEEPLDRSLKLFEEGAGLSATCYDTLKNAEQKISEITKTAPERGEENV